MSRRAVLYVPPSRDADRWIDTCARYAFQNRRTIECVCSDLAESFGELIADRADLLVVATVDQLCRSPLIEVVADAGSEDDPMTRRPQLRRTGRVLPVLDEELMRPARVDAQVIPIHTGRRAARSTAR